MSGRSPRSSVPDGWWHWRWRRGPTANGEWLGPQPRKKMIGDRREVEPARSARRALPTSSAGPCSSDMSLYVALGDACLASAADRAQRRAGSIAALAYWILWIGRGSQLWLSPLTRAHIPRRRGHRAPQPRKQRPIAQWSSRDRDPMDPAPCFSNSPSAANLVEPQ